MFSDRLKNLKPYKPGEQPKDRPYIKLNANENPYNPSPKVFEALQNIDARSLALYPDPDSCALKDAIADMLNKTGGVLTNGVFVNDTFLSGAPLNDASSVAVPSFDASSVGNAFSGAAACGAPINDASSVGAPSFDASSVGNAFSGAAACGAPLNDASSVGAPSCNAAKKLPFTVTRDMVFCGNGSDEVLSFVFYAFFDGTEAPLVLPEFTYSFYPVYAGYYGIKLCKVPLCADFSLDVDTMLKTPSCGMIFANPNAPTGIALTTAEVKAMLDAYPRDKVFVVDEAYTDFSGDTVLPLLQDYPNLLIIRTFSKSMSFAGMRLGFAIGNPLLINALTTVKNSFNHFPADALCQTAGIAACRDYSWYGKNCAAVIKTRDSFTAKLRAAGWNVLPSKTNFVLAGKKGMSGHAVYEAIKKAGILVRYFDLDTIRDFVRITIGTDEQMDALFSVMKSI